MTPNERRSSEEWKIMRWKDVANLGIPASIASVQNGGLVVCTRCHLPEIVLRDHAFVCDNSRCVNATPKRGPAYEGDDQIGVDPMNPHCHCSVACRKRKTHRGIEVEECAALRCDFHGDGEKRELNIKFRSSLYGPTTSGQATPSDSSSFHRTDSSGSLFPKYGRGLGQITPGNGTPRDGMSRSSSMTSFGTHFQGLSMTSSLTMTTCKPDEEPDEKPDFSHSPELHYDFSLPKTPSKPDEELHFDPSLASPTQW